MTPKEYLEQVQQLQRKIEAKERMLGEFDNIIDSAIERNHPSDYLVQKKDEIETEIKGMRSRHIILINEIMTTIEKLDNEKYKLLLILRHFRFMTWKEIAQELSISIATVNRLYIKALDEIEKILKNRKN